MFLIARNTFIFTTIALLLTACGAENKHSEEKELMEKQSPQTKVFRHDKSIQCAGSGIPVDDMRLELAKTGIDVICAQKAHDGMGRTSVCGAATGNINVFVIHNSNLPDAEKLGFRSVEELPDYQDQACIN